MEEYLEHYGTPRHSGRYPWGSGKDPYQKSVALKKYVNELKAQGLSDKEIAAGLGFDSVKQYRSFITISNSEIKKQQYAEALKLKDKGWSNQAIGEYLKPPISEASVRNLLDPARYAKSQKVDNVAQILKNAMDQGKFIDLGEGTGASLGVSETLLDAAKEKLRQEGYEYYTYQNLQQGTGNYTNMRVLCPPGTDFKTMYQNRDKIGIPDQEWTTDGGDVIVHVQDPIRMARNRILVRYAEEGGEDRDGTVELRRGVEDIAMGDAAYAQVRIAVEGDRYMKGMAFYSDDIPAGYDVVYNTNKKKGASDDEVFKAMNLGDPENPFGASIKQTTYTDADGKEHLSIINKVGAGDKANEAGKWDDWDRKLPAQFLAKQPIPFAKKQLELLYKSKEEEYQEILKLTNPVVKKQLLQEFADSCDSASISMEAAALPRQATKVLLPGPELKDNEIYAPGFKAGEEVALVRFPHGGTFEIPLLKVTTDKKLLEKYGEQYKGLDCVAINKKNADRLSGADFDGDTSLVLPTAGQKIKTSNQLEGLKDFDAKRIYSMSEDEIASKYPTQYAKNGKTISAQAKQTQMGLVSNLITDMTIRGAPLDDIEKAVKHSMVVIDSEKHKLDWKQSEADNQILELKKRWQIKEDGRYGGASTLLSAGTGKVDTPIYTERVDPETGKKIRTPKGETYVNKDGKVVTRTVKRARLDLIDDAYELSSGTAIEAVYADHSNKLKRLGEAARREIGATKNTPYSPSAKKTYSQEVDSLNAKLDMVQRNKPRERAAQAIASKVVADYIKADPTLKDDKDKLSKTRNRAMAQARARTGAKRYVVDITDREWEAIQAGAVSSTTLGKILARADKNRVRELATPRDGKSLTPAMTARMKAMIVNGATLDQVAERMGVSPSTVSRAMNAE